MSSHNKVADYVGSIDFRDGTGPSALPPNEVVRAFRDADEIALLGRGGEFWSRLTGDGRSRDDRHHSVGRGDGRAGSRGVGRGSRGAGANGRRRRVVHVESATTGKFFKVGLTHAPFFLPMRDASIRKRSQV